MNTRRTFYLSMPLDSFNADGVATMAERRGAELIAVDNCAYQELSPEEKADLRTAEVEFLFRCQARDIPHAKAILAAIKAELLFEMDAERQADQDGEGEGDSDWDYEADDNSEGTARWS